MAKIKIKWQKLLDDKGVSCTRCQATEVELDQAVARLRELEIDVEIESFTIKNASNPQAANEIQIENKPLESWLGISVGTSKCCDVCGEQGCRTLIVGDITYEVIPAQLIVQASLKAASEKMSEKSSACFGSKGNDKSEPCCPGSSSNNQNSASCCSPVSKSKGGSPGKKIFFVLILFLALGFFVFLVLHLNSSKATSSLHNAEDNSMVCGINLDSLGSLEMHAEGQEAAFLFLPSNQRVDLAAIEVVERTIKNLAEKGRPTIAFTLNRGADGFIEIVNRMQIERFPAVIVGGQSCEPVIIRALEISEENLLNAFIKTTMVDGEECDHEHN